jgi:endonuclease V-like protein UPF0215 family
MALKRYSNVIGIDDAPFERRARDPVPVVGAVYAGLRFDGVVMAQVTRDGSDATDVLSRMIRTSRFDAHIQLVMLQGITLAGFNVIDAAALHEQLDQRPILVVVRRLPHWEPIREALIRHIPEGLKKWRSIESLGPMEPAGAVFIQRVGLGYDQAQELLASFTRHGHIPEPIRCAHLIAGAVGRGHSRGAP